MKILFILLFSFLAFANVCAASLKEQAEAKVIELEGLIEQAENKALDAEREKLALWVATEFIKFADWDEANKSLNEQLFAGFGPYAANKTQMAENLPDQERTDLIQVLNTAIEELTEVINGTVVRRAAVVPDWHNIAQGEDELVSNGKAVFLYDYFSKSFGVDGDDPDVYNDYLGNVDKTLSISSHYVNENMSAVKWRMDKLNKSYDRVGYSLFWHKPLAAWQKSLNEVAVGKTYYMDYDIDNPTMRNAWSNVAKHVAKELKGEKVIDLGYCLANEPHWYSEAGFWTQNYGEMNAISSYTLQNFREWLKEKYNNNIYAFYAKWNQAVSSFDDIQWTVPVPKSYHGTAQWYDWCRFNMDRVNDYFQLLNDAIASEDPNAKTHLKIMSSTFMADRHSGIDLETLTEMSGFIGDDAAAKGRNNKKTTPDAWEENFAYEWKELAMMYDFMESVSPDKIHVNSESHFVSTSQWREMDMQPEYVRNVYWLATLLGMDANLTWFWPRKPDGAPEDRFFDGSYGESSYPGSCAMQPLVVNEYAKVMMDLNAYSEEIMKLRRQKKSIRIFYTEASNIQNNEQLTHDTYELYEKLFFEGLSVGFATQNIIEKQDNNLWDAILIYKTAYMTDADFNALQAYLDAGGTIIIDKGRSMIKNEYAKVQARQLQESNGTIYDMSATATAEQMRDKVLSLVKETPAVELTQDNGLDQKGCLWRVAQDTDGDYLLNIINIGKNAAEISLQMRGGSAPSMVTDMLTGKIIGNSFSIPSEGVYLLKVKGEAVSSINEVFADFGVTITTGMEQLTVHGATGKQITIYDIAGRQLFAQNSHSNAVTIDLPSGLSLVNVEGIGARKVIIK